MLKKYLPFLLLGCIGCARHTTYCTHDVGPGLMRSEVSILHGRFVSSIDDKPVSQTCTLIVLEPGVHKVVFRTTHGVSQLYVKAEEGHTYRIVRESGWGSDMKITDVTADDRYHVESLDLQEDEGKSHNR